MANIAALNPWLPYGTTTFVLTPFDVCYGCITLKMDAIVVVSTLLYQTRGHFCPIVTAVSKSVAFGYTGCALLGFALLFLTRLLRPSSRSSDNECEHGPIPLLIPSRTSHTRLFPKIHSFSYSYFYVGLPVGYHGTVGGILTIDEAERDERPWFSWPPYRLRAEDYLDRGFGHLGLKGKLHKWLSSQGVDHHRYPFAYLITGPRVFGYAFNPVSFWYLYGPDQQLSAVILENNNTFEERHIYLVHPDQPQPTETQPLADLSGLEKDSATHELGDMPLRSEACSQPERIRYTKVIPKDFHVSPFSSRRGAYSFVGYDPLFPTLTGRGPLNNTISLLSSKGNTKVVARVYSDGLPIDPTTMSPIQTAVFLLSWSWVPFLTFPRVVKEAFHLFFRRKLYIWYRPEPNKNSIPRFATATEDALERSFRAYLASRTKAAQVPLVVHYKAAGLARRDPEETFESDVPKNDTTPVQTLVIKVLTPLFYTRFIHYADDMDAYLSESTKSNTLFLSDLDLIGLLISKDHAPHHKHAGWGQILAAAVIRILRQPPMGIVGPPIPKSQSTRKADDVELPIPVSLNVSSADTKHEFASSRSKHESSRIDSPMDIFMLTSTTSKEQTTYLREVLNVFISNWIALGDTTLLALEGCCIRAILAWYATSFIVNWMEKRFV